METNLNLVSLLEAEGKTYRRSGGRYFFCSPFREDSHPSFVVSYHEGKWKWRDFGTGDHGDILDFLRRRGYSLAEAMNMAGQRHRDAVPREAPLPKVDHLGIYRRFVTEARMKEAERWWSKLGVTPPPGTTLVRYKGRDFIATPCPGPGRIESLELRSRDTGPEKTRMTLGRKSPWHLVRPCRSVLVTESILDALAGDVVFSRDYSLVALNGVDLWRKGVDIISEMRSTAVLLALDNDDPGQKTSKKMAQTLWAKERITRVEKINLPDKDLYRYLARYL